MMAMLPLLSALLLGVLVPALSNDWPPLNPAVEWLEKERLRGVLFHDPMIQPLPPRYLMPGDPPPATPPSLTVIGEAYFLLLPHEDGRVGAQIEAVAGNPAFPDTLFAMFDETGNQLLAGTASRGQPVRAEVADVKGVCTLLVNSGPGSRNTARVTPLARSWALDGGPHSFYDNTPLHLHFLRDLKLAGFNLAMIDFERLPDDFLTPEGLADWTAEVQRWADYARQVGLRIMPAVDLGGTPPEVKAWEGCRPGLYIEHFPDMPLAPCPLDPTYWERIYLLRGRAVARLSQTNPFVVGFGLDPEMYMAWNYGHYMLSGTCFCDHCLGGFLDAKGLPRDVLAEATTGKARHEWLQAQQLYGEYDKYLEEEMAKIAAWCRSELHAINPNLLTDMFVTEIGNWFCRGIARGFGVSGLPTLNFAEHTYYGVGYDPDWLRGIIQRYKSWGAHVVQGSAIWDLYFPATEPRFFAAHAYNLMTRGQGYWYWPGDDLYRDRGATYAYYGKPAWQDDFWPAAVSAHREADLWLQDRTRQSPLDAYEPVAWRGKRDEREGRWLVEPEVISEVKIPAYPVHVPVPSTLCFRVPERARVLTLAARMREPGASAELALFAPQGTEAARGAVHSREETRLQVASASAGVWRLEVTGAPDRAGDEIMLALTGPRPFLAPSPEVLPGVISKPRGLIGWWKLDEGAGTVIADSSPPPPLNGRVRGATWAEGVHGAALGFDGKSGEAFIPLDEPFHGLTAFTLSAWVKLQSLPTPGNGRTILNKGPEAPVQHFWWWIGYPPSYALILEMGNEKHRWGTSFASQALQWELDRWYHVAVTFERVGDTCTVRHYRDGTLVGESVKEDDLHSGSHDLRLGTYGSLHWMHGAIDDVRFYDTALTGEEIARQAGP